MTSLLEFGTGESYSRVSSKDVNHNIRHRCKKYKAFKCKPKCERYLKRKLKKYKLRKDAKEDEDIIDVSNIFVSSLYIKSPEKTSKLDPDLEAIPKNYLFRMVKRKHVKNEISDVKATTIVNEHELQDISLSLEEKKTTNAFKVLMDSRSKSIGNNSPGKDKPIDELEVQEKLERKGNKAKRNLMLQKMAEAKGSLKKKEIEENEEKYIKRQMDKRAEKLKSMIFNKEPKSTGIKRKVSLNMKKGQLKNTKSDKTEVNTVRPFQEVNIFTDIIANSLSPKKETHKITQEDSEFLRKLSPSLKKKESMLSYFNKVEKDCIRPLEDSGNDDGIIKVKISSITKKKGKKKKLSLKRDNLNSIENVNEIKVTDDDTQIQDKNEVHCEQVSEKKDNDMRKRKRKMKVCDQHDDSPTATQALHSHETETRPKRNVTKPVKYKDDIYLTSSDDEYVIFTPKKKRPLESKKQVRSNIPLDEAINNCTELESIPLKNVSSSSKNISNEVNGKKKEKHDKVCMAVKLAPIFTKPQSNPTVSEARQKFLMSGAPDQLKKSKPQQNTNLTLNNSFCKVVHIQQLHVERMSSHPLLNLSEIENNDNYNISVNIQNTNLEFFRQLIIMTSFKSAQCIEPKCSGNLQATLNSIKEKNPKFPVYRTYSMLRGKKKGEYTNTNIYSNLDDSIEILNSSIDVCYDNPDQLTWADKYKPLSCGEIIGNIDTVKELRKWLVTWTANMTKSKKSVPKTKSSDSSDYYQSDADSKDSMKTNNNLLVLTGPTGCGKSSCVYAAAAELSIKVIEVNASSKRTGKIMLQDLQEATQSHKVNRAPSSAENSQKSQDITELIPINKVEGKKRKGRPKKVTLTSKKPVLNEKSDMNGVNTNQDARTAMSLILIDDADIVFEQDDGFCSAIVQLVQSSKRPVILITSSLSCLHLQRFLVGCKLLKMQPLVPNVLGTWLDLMCLADSGSCWPGSGAKFLNYFNGDVRKTVNCLQFYICSQNPASLKDSLPIDSQNNDFIKDSAEAENSNMSWVNHECVEENNIEIESAWFWKNFINGQGHPSEHRYSFELFNMWMNVPKLLNVSNLDIHTNTGFQVSNKKTEYLHTCHRVLDSISISDYWGYKCSRVETDLTSSPWLCPESDSVCELENTDDYNKAYEMANEMSYELVKVSINNAKTKLGVQNDCDLEFPGMSKKRRRDRVTSRHHELSSFLSAQSALDRKALALDYWPSCRTICRIEKSRTDSNLKRNNRFCHYLKSLSILCKNDSFDHLAKSLNPADDL